MTPTVESRDLAFALRVLVHEARGALAGIRPVIAGLLAPDAPPPPADDAVARLNAVERVLNQVAAVYRRRTSLRDQLAPAELEALLAAVYTLPAAQAPAGDDLPPGLQDELEIALRVLVHEVGNALTSVKPLIDILHRNPAYLWRLPPGERATSARLSLGRLDDTVQVLAQIGDLRPHAERVRLRDLADAVAQEVAGEAAAGFAAPGAAPPPAVRVDCPADLCARADPLWLRHSLRNLVDNARRVTPPGEHVTVAGYARPDGVALSVRDAGPGLAQDELDYIFHAGLAARTQIRRPLAVSGAGIGLSLVRYWIYAMHGTIEAASRQAPPTGTRVTLVLPPAEGAP